MTYVYWITGLSGAGKTSIGTLLYEKIKQKYPNTVFLDGDVLREVFGNDLGYTRDERMKCAMRYARLCKMLQAQEMNVICCTISMFDDIRSWNRENVGNYREIYVRVSMEVLKKRNQKGLYSTSMEVLKKRNQKGLYSTSMEESTKRNKTGLDSPSVENKEVAGIHVDIEEPRNPDMILDNEGNVSVMELVNRMIEKFGI
ncbi:MAG: adenylyl-sulfate kinase [Lachnospiraceae bacterium]|nr:adenylyl-sulfate kinase [Lachnospiraceae bacterium]